MLAAGSCDEADGDRPGRRGRAVEYPARELLVWQPPIQGRGCIVPGQRILVRSRLLIESRQRALAPGK
jgi:hypothetical protein